VAVEDRGGDGDTEPGPELLHGVERAGRLADLLGERR
jgi:hypothetical protein